MTGMAADSALQKGLGCVMSELFHSPDNVGVTKTRNGKRNGMENGMKRKTKLKFRMKTKYMNFVDTTAYKGKRFEIKQNFDF